MFIADQIQWARDEFHKEAFTHKDHRWIRDVRSEAFCWYLTH